VARHIFQAFPVWIYTQSNITQAEYNKVLHSIILHIRYFSHLKRQCTGGTVYVVCLRNHEIGVTKINLILLI
jgi:hypothetical protein